MRSNGLIISKHCQPNTYVLDVDSNLEKWDNDEADEFTLIVFTL